MLTSTPVTYSSKPQPSHIRFHAPSRAAVRGFYAAALRAGARQVHSPGYRASAGADVFNTFVNDRDGNNIEVSFTDEESLDGSEIDRSAVMDWQRDIATSARSHVSHGSRHSASHHSHHSIQKLPSKAEQSAPTVRQSAPTVRQSVVDDAPRSHVSRHTGRSSARSAVSHSGSRVPTEVIPVPPSGPGGAGDFMPQLFRHVSGPIETLLTKADPVSGTVPTKTVVGTMLGAAAGAAFAYAMCASEDGKTRREQWRYVKWDPNGYPHYADGDARTIVPLRKMDRNISRPEKSRSFALPESMSRLAIEPPPAAEAPSRFSTHSRRAGTEINAPSHGGSRRRSRSVSSRHTAPIAFSNAPSHRSNRQSSHPPPSSRHSLRESLHEPHRSSHHSASRHSSRHSESRSSATLVPPNLPVVEEKGVESAPEMDLDIDTATVAPDDSISCAGDKYSRSGDRRSRSSNSAPTGGKYRGWYAGSRGMDRIIEVERKSEPISARRVSRLVY